jgi:site-specific DNA-methyltransferase (adenine-specific)
MFSSLRPDWRTPEALYSALSEEFGITFDPCPRNPTFDGLSVPWNGNVYVNPPYGNAITAWAKKGAAEFDAGRAECVVWLVAARTDTVWFHDYLLPRASELRFIRGRLHFDDGPGGAPFPSLVVVWRRA